MKKFITPLAIKIANKEEGEALIKPLKNLGYVFSSAKGADAPNCYLVTNWMGERGVLAYNNRPHFSFGRIEVRASKPELVLALAAMTKGEDWEVGEYLIGHLKALTSYKKIFKVTKLSGCDWFNGLAGNDYKHFYRKATTQEILDHFKQKDMPAYANFNLEEPMKKKIIGYKLIKPEFKRAASAIAFGNTSWLPQIHNDTLSTNQKEAIGKLQDANVFYSWFEPVYEEEKKTVNVKHSNGVLEVEIKDGKAWYENYSFSREQLEHLLKPSNLTVKFVPESFTAGCNGQYKNISREDIQKVIDALN